MATLRDSFESVTHSFIVRIWLEEEDRACWRGHITHVPGGERQYVEQLSDIADFIAPYVPGMKSGPRGVLRRWLSRWKKGRRRSAEEGHGEEG